jgi:hypothetical protein
MLKQLGLVAAFSLMASSAAWADPGACGDEPIPPAIPSVADIGQRPPVDAQKAKHQAFEDIRSWQAALKDYRNCLDSDQNSTKRQVQDAQGQTKPDKDKITKLQGEIAADAKGYDHSTDTEEKIVNDFHSLSVAYCARGDVDKSSCPKT